TSPEKGAPRAGGQQRRPRGTRDLDALARCFSASSVRPSAIALSAATNPSWRLEMNEAIRRARGDGMGYRRATVSNDVTAVSLATGARAEYRESPRRLSL